MSNQVTDTPQEKLTQLQHQVNELHEALTQARLAEPTARSERERAVKLRIHQRRVEILEEALRDAEAQLHQLDGTHSGLGQSS